jgi:septum formation protein
MTRHPHILATCDVASSPSQTCAIISINIFGKETVSDKRLFVLASRSPRRRELLGLAGFMFSAMSVDLDETPYPDENPRQYTLRLSQEKAQAAVEHVQGQPIIIAADTTVADRGDILGKPDNPAQAEDMLMRLRGRTHQVYTAVSVLDTLTNQMDSEVCCTDVPMRDYSDNEIAVYVSSGDPFDKAGSYAIQHEGFHPVATRTGCYANVIGLPLCHLLKILRRMDIPLKQDIPFLCQTAHDYECGVFTSILRTGNRR